MAHAIQIDTLAFAKKLRAAGADERLADAIVEGITAADTSQLATKADLSALGTDLREEIADVKAELKEEIVELRDDIKSLELRMTTRLGGLMAIGIGVVATLVSIF